MISSLTGHLAAIGLLLFAVGFTLIVYFKSRRDVEKMREDIHHDIEKMTESLLYVIDGLTKIRNESNHILEEHEEHDRKIGEQLEQLNKILEKTKNGNGSNGTNGSGKLH